MSSYNNNQNNQNDGSPAPAAASVGQSSNLARAIPPQLDALQLAMLSQVVPQAQVQGQRVLTLDSLVPLAAIQQGRVPRSTTAPTHQPLSTQPSLIDQLQLMAHLNNQQQIQLAPASSFPQASLVNQLAAAQALQASTSLSPSSQQVASSQASLVNQLAAAQALQASTLLPSSSQQVASSLTLEQLLSRLGQNVPLASILASQNQSALVQNTIPPDNSQAQLIATLLSQQQMRLPIQSNSRVQNNNMRPRVGQLEMLTMAANSAQTGQGLGQPNNVGNAASLSQVSNHQLRSLVQNMGHANPRLINIATSNQATMPVAHPLLARSSEATRQTLSSDTQASSPARETASSGAAAAAVAADGGSQSRAEDPTDANERWMLRYRELKQFRRDHGHCRVPHRYSENIKLAWWVMNQRADYRRLQQGQKSWLSEERVQMLNDIKFDWTLYIGRNSKKLPKKSSVKKEDNDSS